MVVILIIGILVGMLLPAIQAAKVAALRTQALSEIAQLSTGIANAKTTMNARFVPSMAYISSSATDPQFFPGTTPNPSWNFTQNFFGARLLTSTLPTLNSTYLDGNQCLVFFLGGYNSSASPSYFQGFAQNVTQPTGPGTSRNGPFFDFPQNRINSSHQFTDPWGTPYVYMSTVNGNGDYTYQLPSIFATAGATLTPYHYPNGNVINPNGFQIISAGPNGLQPGIANLGFGPGGSSWGPGGAYSAGAPGADDLSNFYAGSLKQ
jgi:type II secretory pathway pseudopilin PulG